MGTTRYGYTSFGAVQSEDGPWDNDTVSLTYQNRLRTGLSVSAPNATPWTQTYTYDAANRLKTLTSPAGTHTYDYASNPSHLIRKLTLPGSAYITNAHDSVARLTGTWLKNSSHATLNSHEYTYNVGNQRTRQTRTGGDFVDYAYDSVGQLKSAGGKESGGTTNRLHEQLSNVYDAAGNLNYRTNNEFKPFW